MHGGMCGWVKGVIRPEDEDMRHEQSVLFTGCALVGLGARLLCLEGSELPLFPLSATAPEPDAEYQQHAANHRRNDDVALEECGVCVGGSGRRGGGV